MLSMKSRQSLPSTSRKYSAWARPVRRDAGAGARRLVHLAIDQGALAAHGRAGLGVHIDVGLDHLVIKVVAFAGALADAGQHRVAAIGLGDVVDQFLHGDGLADAGAAEQADLAALGVGAEQVDDLDAGDQDFGRAGLLGKAGGFAMDRGGVFGADRAGFVDRLADHVHDAAKAGRADRHGDRAAGVGDFLAADQAFGGVHGDGAHGVLAQMLRHFEHQADLLAGLGVGVGGLQRVQDRGQLTVELDVDDGADDLAEAALEVVLLMACLFLFNGGRSGTPVFLNSGGAGDDFDQFRRDLGLTGAVHLDGEGIDHVAGIAGGVVHRRHLAAKKPAWFFQHGGEQLHRDVPRQQGFQDRCLHPARNRRSCRSASPSSTWAGISCLTGRHLGHHRLEAVIDQRNDVEPAAGVEVEDLLRDRLHQRQVRRLAGPAHRSR